MAGTTQNGWPYPPQLRTYPVSGTAGDVSLVLTADQNAASILVWCVEEWHATIEPVLRQQTGGYDGNRPVGGLGGTTSNHMSGTAVDVNWEKHPQYAHTFSDTMTAQIHAIIAATEGVVRWGGDYSAAYLDQMHIELNTTDQTLIKRVSAKLLAGGPPISPVPSTSGVPGVTVTAPDPTVVTIVKQPKLPLTAITGRAPVNGAGQLPLVRIGGRGFVTDLQAVVISASMSYAQDQVGYLTMTVQDDAAGSLLSSGYVALGMPVTFVDQRLDLRTIEVGDGQGGPLIRMEARSRTIFRLRSGAQVGEGSWGAVDTGRWLADRCAEVGARLVCQPGLYYLVVTRLAGESTWDVMQKLAGLHQAWCFECEQTIYFGQPTWLASRKNVRGWRLHWSGLSNYTAGLMAMPAYRSTADATDPGGVERLTLTLGSTDVYQMRPGDLVALTGDVGEMRGWWIVMTVLLDLGGASRVTGNVVAQRVVNPNPSGQILNAGTAAQTQVAGTPGMEQP